MMRIPFSYIWRSLWARRLTTALTVGGVALVVFVFAGVLMLARGLEAALIETGSPANVIVLRRSATSELSSQVDRATADVLEAESGVARGAEGRAILSREVILVIDLYKKKSNALGNVSIRGVSPRASELRPGVHIVQGRPFQFGTHEVVVGKGIASLFKGVALGAELAFGGDRWTVVGIADAGGTAFDSEIWGDADQFMQAFGRPVYSSLTFRLAQLGGFDQLKARLQADPRTQYVELKHERDYYQEQSKTLATFIRTLGIVVTTIFSFGAMIGAMITMYAAVANRTVEVGTLRALGFRRRSVLGAFLVESVVLALVGGALGVALAALLSFERISVVNFQSFSEIGFGFALSPGVVTRALIFAVVMGVVGIADAGGTAFDSEIWGDADQFMQAFGRPVYSSLTFRLAQPGGFDQLKARLQADPRMQYVELKHERDYYQEQSKTLATFIRTLGIVVTTIFSFGAMIGAMITMYAAVANRTVEVGTLRALGFRRRSVLGAFLVESVMLALVGGALGVALAALLSFERISVVNFQSFSEIGFGFALSPGVIARALVFAVVMGVVGGFLPAARAARLNIVNALRAS